MNKLKNSLYSAFGITGSDDEKLSQQLGYKFLTHEHFNTWDNKSSSSKLNRGLPSVNPIAYEDAQKVDLDEPDPEVGHKATILMVDDEDVCLYSMKIMLMGTPYSLVTLNKSTEAIEYIYANIYNIDLIFLDLNMPEINGLELLEKIKSDRMLSCIPVILQSACANDNDIIKAYILGISSFLQKPYKKNQVLSAIKGVLDDKTVS